MLGHKSCPFLLHYEDGNRDPTCWCLCLLTCFRDERDCSLKASEGHVFIRLEADEHYTRGAQHGGRNNKTTKPCWLKPSQGQTRSRAQQIDMALDRGEKKLSFRQLLRNKLFWLVSQFIFRIEKLPLPMPLRELVWANGFISMALSPSDP